MPTSNPNNPTWTAVNTANSSTTWTTANVKYLVYPAQDGDTPSEKRGVAKPDDSALAWLEKRVDEVRERAFA